MTWKFDSKIPVSLQLTHKLRIDILSGKYSPGEQFPPVRQLAYDASVNPNTVQKALTSLESEGLLITRGTVGRFVTDDESALTKAKLSLMNEYMSRIVKEAAELGITREMFINYLKESEETK